MLPSTRQFARERLSSEETERLDSQHAMWFIDALDRADEVLQAKGGETQNEARQWIDAEHENVEQAVAWSEAKAPVLFQRAALALAVYLSQKGRFSEMVRLYEELLRRLERAAAEREWAAAQNTLGLAYWNLPTGNRGENLARAIVCYEAAISVRTECDSPIDWAVTQNNLGVVYSDLSTGDRGENLAKAISHYEAALSIYTERDFPMEWAMTQNNLGAACALGHRGENLAKAIACYEAALRVYTERDFPMGWG